MTNNTTAPDLIERLRGAFFRFESGYDITQEAADALEAAQARIAELEGALRDIAAPKCGPDFDWSDREVNEWRASKWKWAQKTARAALQEGKG